MTKRLGGRVVAREAELSVDVRAADWIPVRVARVFVNGEAVAERRLDGAGSPLT